ncbi:hypothetical protein EDB85DRAFT_1917085 [Lactarius pseudohatsudake]|nr:hypothetical protein EDB85DRAFT_1917085 [Lactarius pseudohatsudake]
MEIQRLVTRKTTSSYRMDMSNNVDAGRNSDQPTDVRVTDWRSILTLVVFFLTNIVVIFPFRIPLPNITVSTVHNALVKCRAIPRTSEPPRRRYLYVNYLSVPTIAVLLLLATKAIDATVLRHGIIGADGIQPINIMALFISLAYLSISLDATGLLRFLAFWVAKKGGASGPKLHFYLYLFFLTCAAVVGNDPVILSGTTFLAYLTRVLGITPPTAWIFTQFTAANMASALLISSNPTNLVLSGAFTLSFITYTSSVALPLLAAALTVYPFHSIVLFRSPGLIPTSIELPSNAVGGDRVGVDRPSTALIDKPGAVFGSILLLVTLGVLVGTSTIGVPVWQVAAPAAVMMLSHDVWRDWNHYRSDQVVAEGVRQSDRIPPTGIHLPIELGVLPLSTSRLDDGKPGQDIKPELTLSSLLLTCAHRVLGKVPGVCGICKKLPVALVPFAFLMFILVQGLASQGWVHVFAHWWGAWVNKTGVVGAAAGMTIGSGLLCNICGTNIGTTILLARVVQEWQSSMEAVPTGVQYASVYGLAIGSNYGAFTLTFSASLAGMLWRDILRQKGIHVRGWQFAGLNVGTFLVASVASGAVLIGQTLVVHGG